MNLLAYVTEYLDFMTIIPAAILCYVPVMRRLKSPIALREFSEHVSEHTAGGWSWEWMDSFAESGDCLRVERSWIFCRMLPLLFLLLAVLALLAQWIGLNNNYFLLPVLVLCFVGYKRTVTLPFWKALYLYLNGACVVSYGVILGDYLEYYFFEAGGSNLADIKAAICRLLASVFCSLIYLLINGHGIQWMTMHTDEKRIWHLQCTIPVLLCLLNLFMLPRSTEVVHAGRVFEVALVIVVAFFLLFLMLNELFYQIRRRLMENARLQQENALLSIEARQYLQLQQHMEETRRLRHDFRQQIAVITELAALNRTEELRQYLANYTKNLPKQSPLEYCKDPAVNAILTYYAELAEQQGIRTAFQVSLPAKLPFSETDLGVLIGNLLENAIDGCKTIVQTGTNRPEAVISLKLTMPAEETLGLVIRNPYGGDRGDSRQTRVGTASFGIGFQSTKHEGKGIGLVSVEGIVRRYHGTLRIDPDNGQFKVSLLLYCTHEG